MCESLEEDDEGISKGSRLEEEQEGRGAHIEESTSRDLGGIDLDLERGKIS